MISIETEASPTLLTPDKAYALGQSYVSAVRIFPVAGDQ